MVKKTVKHGLLEGRDWALMFGFTGIELGQGALWDPFEHLLGEDSHQLPANIKGLVYISVLISTCWTENTNKWHLCVGSLYVFKIVKINDKQIKFSFKKNVQIRSQPILLTLRDEILLKFLQEFQVQKIICSQGFLPHHSLHGLNILPNGIASILPTKNTRLAYRPTNTACQCRTIRCMHSYSRQS